MPEVTPETAMQQLEKEGPAPVYVLTGEEEMLQQRFLAALKQRLWPDGEDGTLHEHRSSGDEHTVEEIVALASTPGFFNRRRLIVVSDHPVLTQGTDPGPLLKYLNDVNEEACLVLRHQGKLDGRRSLTRTLRRQAVVVNCETPKRESLHAWIRSRFEQLDKRAEPAAVARLAGAFPDGLQLLHSEIEKIAIHTGDAARVTRQDVDAVLAGPQATNVFDLVDAIGERRVAAALAELDALLADGEPPLRILYMISRQIRLIWQAAALQSRGLGKQGIQKELGQHPFVVGKMLAQTRHFRSHELALAMERLLRADLAMKGSQQQAAVLETLVISLAGGLQQPGTTGFSQDVTRR